MSLPPPRREQIAEAVGGAFDAFEVRVFQAVVIVEGHRAVVGSVAHDQFDRLIRTLGGGDSRPKIGGGRGLAVHRDDLHPDGQRLFEGKARARSRDDSLPHLVPNLVEALFTGFPGRSGEEIRITVPPPPKAG